MTKHRKAQISKNRTIKSIVLKEQCPESLQLRIEVNLLIENGKLWIQPEGFGDRCSEDGEGWPVSIEIWQGRLRLIVFDDINREDPQIIDLENAKESCRVGKEKGCDCKSGCDGYCAAAQCLTDEGREIFTGPMNGGFWNARCMDACIMSKKQGDKAAYEHLLKFGDQLAASLLAEQKLRWRNVKDKAAALLKDKENKSSITLT